MRSQQPVFEPQTTAISNAPELCRLAALTEGFLRPGQLSSDMRARPPLGRLPVTTMPAIRSRSQSFNSQSDSEAAASSRAVGRVKKGKFWPRTLCHTIFHRQRSIRNETGKRMDGFLRLLTLPEIPTFFVRLDILTDWKGGGLGLQR